MRTWLVLDCHYLCHRAFHTMKDLTHRERPTGVIYGFLKTISVLKDEFQTDDVAFCFEHPKLFRRDLFSEYKASRHKQERTEEEQQAYKELTVQIAELGKRYLPRIGFQNIFRYRGMEADDIMAEIARCCDEDEVVLVTADSDLFQCLTTNVRVWNPAKRKLFTDTWFKRKLGINSFDWAKVKAIAGCSSDNVPGIKGVGEKTAIKYLKRELSYETKAYQAITSEEGKRIIRRNRRLVELPFEDCPTPRLRTDTLNMKGWRSVCKTLGIRSLSKPPIRKRGLDGS